MSNNDRLTYLGILSAPTDQGPRAIAVALSGAVSLHHFVDAGLDTDAEVVRDWLWSMGINPDNVATAMPADVLIRDILIPSIGNRSEEHTSELQSLMRISYAVFCLKTKKKTLTSHTHIIQI